MKFAEKLTKENGIATIPLSPFYSEKNNQKFLRVCFAKTDSVLEKAADILRNV